MSSTPVLQGELVQLTAINVAEDVPLFVEWSQDTEYWRLEAADPEIPRRLSRIEEDFNRSEISGREIDFAIRTLIDPITIGYADLEMTNQANRDCYLGIGIGRREYWNRGYGTDVMRVLLRYAFEALNLHRVSLNVFEYNERAITCYRKAGFIEEGRQREFLRRDNQFWDLIYMGILRSEWEKRVSDHG
ncbi:MAG: GNAT family protein [Anaerolineaceae bacterium]